MLPEEERKLLETKGELVVTPTAAVVVPTTLLPKIIDAMLENYARYLAAHRESLKLSETDQALLKDIDKAKGN